MGSTETHAAATAADMPTAEVHAAATAEVSATAATKVRSATATEVAATAVTSASTTASSWTGVGGAREKGSYRDNGINPDL